MYKQIKGAIKPLITDKELYKKVKAEIKKIIAGKLDLNKAIKFLKEEKPEELTKKYKTEENKSTKEANELRMFLRDLLEAYNDEESKKITYTGIKPFAAPILELLGKEAIVKAVKERGKRTLLGYGF